MKQIVVLWPVMIVTIFNLCHGLKIKSCSKNAADDIIRINWLNTNPAPVQVPGELFISASATLLRSLTGTVQADITISRHFGLMWIDLPCVQTSFGHLGSCTYRDLCSILNSVNGTCPRFMREANIPCSCPIPARTYTIPRTSVTLDPKIFGIPLPSVSGEYQASIRLTDSTTSKMLSCYDIDLEIVGPPSSSTFGSIGRFFVNLFG